MKTLRSLVIGLGILICGCGVKPPVKANYVTNYPNTTYGTYMGHGQRYTTTQGQTMNRPGQGYYTGYYNQ